jgi:cell division protein ZapA (FtsZ GTPase activity inhibitor)
MKNIYSEVVTILGKSIKVHCPKESKVQLIEAAKQLNKRLKTKKDQPRQDRDEMLAVTALNIMHELLLLQDAHDNVQQNFEAEVNKLLEKIEVEE